MGLGCCEAKQVGVFAKETNNRLTTLNKSLQFYSRCCCSCCCIYFNYSRKAQSHTFYWKNEHKEKTQSNNNNYYSITSKNFQFIFGCNFTHTHSYMHIHILCQCDLWRGAIVRLLMVVVLAVLVSNRRFYLILAYLLKYRILTLHLRVTKRRTFQITAVRLLPKCKHNY